MEKYCIVNRQIAIFKGETDEIVTVKPIEGIDYLFDIKDSVNVTVDGITYLGVVLTKDSEITIDALGWQKADEAIGKVITYENGYETCKGVVLDVAGEVYVTHQTDDEIVYIPKEEAKVC